MNLPRKRLKNFKSSRSPSTPIQGNPTSPSPLDSIQKDLLDKKKAITREIETHLNQHLNEDLQLKIDSALDAGDQSILDLAEDIDLSLLEMRNKTLKNINNALRRLKDKTYGNCEECLEPIPERRLIAMPYVRTCIPCQEKLEIMEKIERSEDRFK